MLKGKSVQLIQELNILIKKYGSNDKVRKIIIDEFNSRNMKGSLATNILTERLELSTLDIDNNKELILLFVFTKSLFTALTFKPSVDSPILGEISEGLKITPEDYFTEIEIEDFTDYKLAKKVDTKKQYVFHNMILVSEGYYKGIVSAQYLAEMDAENDIIYNFKNQRDPYIDVYGIKRIHIDKHKIERITNRLLTGTQFSDEIKLNLLHDGTDQLYYNEKTKELIIISGTLNIFDGYHRKTSSSNAIAKNPDLNFNWGLVITNFSEKKTQEFMVQINEQKPMRQEHIKALDTSKLGNIVVNSIRDIDTSEFAQNIKESDAELKFSGMTKKSTLAISIEETYKEKLTRLQVKPIAKHIANVLDCIIGLHVEEFIVHPEETQKVSYINHKNMFAGYVALSEKLYGDKDWENKLEQTLDKIDFNIDNDFWKDNKLTDQDMSKTTRNALYKLFRSVL